MTDAVRAAGLLFRYVRKELTREEERELTDWRYQSPENEQLFQEKTDRTRILAELGRRLEKNDRLKKDIDNYFSDDPRRWPHQYHVGRFRVTRIVAVSFLVLGIGFFLFFDRGRKPAQRFEAVMTDPEGVKFALDDIHRGYLTYQSGIRQEEDKNGMEIFIAASDRKAAPDKYYTVYTNRGLFHLRLPDSTFVWLNQNSEIRYPANFSGESIRIYIKGEAYVDMPTHAKTSLQITAFPVTVTGAGARINLRAYPDELVTKITLLDGSVHIYSDPHTGKTDSASPLLPGQEVRWENGKFSSPAPVNVDKVVRWKK
jgi:transmembrane sensor